MKKFILVLGLVSLTIGLRADEAVTLTSPITKPNTTTIHIQRVTFDIDQKSISVQFIGDDGLAGSAFYPTPAPASNPTQPTGAALISTVNTGNNTVNSMAKKILQRLQSDGYIPAGNVSGTPN